MKKVLALFLFLSLQAKAAPFTFTLINNSINSDAIDLGGINSQLCSSPNLLGMTQLSDGISNGTCISSNQAGVINVSIIIPVRIEMISSEAYDIAFSKESNGNDFELFSLKNIRDAAVGGGIELINSTISMNNESINAEMELTAEVAGPNAQNSYSNTLNIDISPTP